MTNEQLRQNAAAMLAFADGKPIQIQYHFSGMWEDWRVGDVDCWHAHGFRPKPVPVSRPWAKPSDVPGPVCWIREGGMVGVMIVGFTNGGVIIGTGPYSYWEWSHIERGATEYSTSRRADDWHPCIVEDQP